MVDSPFLISSPGNPTPHLPSVAQGTETIEQLIAANRALARRCESTAAAWNQIVTNALNGDRDAVRRIAEDEYIVVRALKVLAQLLREAESGTS